MIVPIINESVFSNPKYKTSGSAGMDLKASIFEPIVIQPMERKLISTGIHIELPLGYEAQVRGRSGLANEYGIAITNGIGTVDSDYRGEIKVNLINFGSEPFTIRGGDRIAQLVIAKVETVEWDNVLILNDTSRGQGGFGHTGI